MQRVIVYSMDYVKRVKKPVGEVLERRKSFRPDNLSGLLVIARKKFSSNPQDAFQITIDSGVQYINR